MKKYLLGFITAIAAVLVVLTVARDVAVPYTQENREKAVAQLSAKLRVPVPGTEDQRTPSTLTPPVDPVPETPAQWEPFYKQGGDVPVDFGRLYNIQPKFVRQRFQVNPPLAVSHEEQAALDAVIERHRAFFDQAYELAANGPSFVCEKYGTNYFLRALSIRPFVRIVDHDVDGAVSDLLALARHVPMLTLSEDLFELDIAIVETVRALLSDPASDIKKAEKLADLYQALHTRKLFADTLRDKMHRLLRNYLSADIYSWSIVGSMGWRAYRSVLRPMYDHDIEGFSTDVSRMLDVIDRPFSEIRPALEEIEQRQVDRLFKRPVDSIAVAVGFADQARHETIAALLRIVVAVHTYQRCHGAFPETLDACADLLGGPVPLQPLSNRPFTYRKEGEHIELEGSAPQNWGRETYTLTWQY